MMSDELRSKRYEPPVIDLENKNSSHTLIVELTGRNKNVLEVGTSTGYISRILKERGNTVTGIEIDPEAGEIAGQHCDTMIIGDIEKLDLDAYLTPSSFDVIVFGDVLEHLVSPEDVLRKVKKYLRPDGYLAVSLPNVCHGDVILNLLMGDFKYTSMGLLDATHLRFFGLRNIIDLFSRCGYFVTDLQTTVHPVGATEQRLDPGVVPEDLANFVKSLPNSSVYQYIFKASPSPTPEAVEAVPAPDLDGLFRGAIEGSIQAETKPILEEIHAYEARTASLAERVEQLTEKTLLLQRTIADRDAQVALLDGQVEQLTEKTQSLQGTVSERDAQIALLAEQVEQLTEETQSLQGTVSERDAQIASLNEQTRQQAAQLMRLSNELASIKQSIVWRLLMKYHNGFVERLLPLGSRSRRWYDLALTGGRVMINSGPKAFWWSFKAHFRDSDYFNQNTVIPPSSGDRFCITSSEFWPIGDVKILVQVHVYYVDLFEEICSYLKNIPVKFTLAVSVTKEEDKEFVIRQIKRLPLVQSAEVKVVKNRGRDIAPLLVDFGPLIREHDFICHIHTKKSLFTGRDQVEWREYLFSMLLGSSDRVQAIFSAFKKDPSVGLIYPEIYPYLPYSACTWLSNKGIAPSVLSRLGVRFDADEYIDFPAGSMFWARREALEPLLNLGFSSSDFPDECGQNDGALQHTIERCFVLAAQSRGLKYLVLQDLNSHAFSYQSGKNLNQYFEPPFEEKVLNHLSVTNTVSFDIFDTILIRPFASPDMVFSYMEEMVAKELGIANFRKLRKDSEKIARERKHYLGDVKISEIYLVLAELARIGPEAAEKLLNLEVNIEKTLLIPRGEVINLAKYAKDSGKRVILVSDTYLERRHIENILSSKGIDFYDGLYLSCESGKRKDRGDLWKYVLECEDATRDNFLHIGDNEQSDVQMIGDLGFNRLVHVMRPTALFRQSDLGRCLWEMLRPYNDWRGNLLYGMFANLYCSNPNERRVFTFKDPLSDPFSFGYIVFGPIVFNFMRWLLETSMKDGVRQLWFIAREGYLLNQAFETIVEHPDLDQVRGKLPQGSEQLCSRRAATFAVLRTEEDIPRLLKGRFRGSLRTFFEARLSTSDMTSIESRIGADILDQTFSLPEDYNQIFKYIVDVFDILTRQAQDERDALLQYCSNQGFNGSERIGIVDVGYSGTIQEALTEVVSHPLNGYYFITEKPASKLCSSGSDCKAYFGEFIDPMKKTLPIHRYSLLLEAVLTAPTGQLLRFCRGSEDATEIIPEFKDPGISQDKFPIINQIHEGILRFILDMMDRFGSSALDIEFPKDLAQLCYELVAKGDLGIGNLRFALSVEDEYCGNGEISPLELYGNS